MVSHEESPFRRLRLFLRDHRILDAHTRIPVGQSLGTYLAHRTRYVNIVDVDWVGTGETIAHMALKVDAVLWASSRDGDVELCTSIGTAGARQVEIEMEGGYLIAAELPLVEQQRLSDYLQSAPGFIPLREAQLRPRGTALGDVVLNQAAIQLVRERPASD
jgi:hypothetical protein